MADNADRKAQLRREREAKARADERRQRTRRRAGYAVAGALVVGGVIAAVAVVAGSISDKGRKAAVLPEGGSVPQTRRADLKTAARSAGCDLRRVRIKNRRHVQGKVRYPTNPPAGGDHFEVPAEDGIYESPPPTERLVHALEHGRVVTWFKRSLPRNERADLRAYFENDSYQGLLAPDATESRYAVAATAWNRDPTPIGAGRLLGCRDLDAATYTALAAFRDEHRGNGPEPVP